MDYVNQANSLSDDKKTYAKKLYLSAIAKAVNKNYKPLHPNSFVDISTIFIMSWCEKFKFSGNYSSIPHLFAEANTAFNFANLDSLAKLNLINKLKHITKEQDIIDDEKIKILIMELGHLLTNTTIQKERQNENFH